MLKTLVRWNYDCERAPTYRSISTIRDRMILWPERVRVAIGGWASRWRMKPGNAGYALLRGIMYRGPRKGSRLASDRRGHVLIRWMEEDEKLSVEDARRRWNLLPLPERKKLSPGNPRPIESNRSARYLIAQAKKGKVARRTKKGHAEDRMVWPCTAAEQEARKLRD